MTPSPALTFAGPRVLVVGLGRFGGGVGVTRWLARRGARVTVTDSANADSLAESVAELADVEVRFCLGGHGGIRAADYELAIINPAVRKEQSELFSEIARNNIPWTTELNLFCERCRAPVIGVTGSYGKSTTCAMLAHVLESFAGPHGAAPSSSDRRFRRVHLGGNIGRSLLSDLSDIQESDVVVLEISNAQLEDLPRIRWAPRTAVITNIFPHHLDRYSGFDGYIAAKLNIVADDSDQRLVVGDLHPQAEIRLREKLGGNLVRVVRVGSPPGDLRLSIPGRHNLVNAGCVLTVAAALGLEDSRVSRAVTEFHGLPHRMELVGRFGGATYINDSKSTAPTATIMAVQTAMEMLALPPTSSPIGNSRDVRDKDTGSTPERQLIVIVGGQDKNVCFDECAALLARHSRLVICTGQSGPAFANAVVAASVSPTHRFESSPGVHLVADLPAAVQYARTHAEQDDVVLFSPGAPSFDQYANFTERGRHFAELVRELGSGVM